MRNPCLSLLLSTIAALAAFQFPAPLSAQSIENAPAASPFAESYRSALISYKNGDYKAAREETANAAKLKPTEADTAKLKLLQARIDIELANFASAEKLVQSVIDNAPDNALAYYYLGDVYLRQRTFLPARDAYLKFLKLKPKDPDAVLKLVYCHVARNDLSEAGKILLQLDQFSDLHPGYYFGKAAIAQAGGKQADAEKDLNNARTMYGNDTFALYMKTYLAVFPSKKS
jgi:tetratricopeptide (TPR) repeat protein